MAFSITKELPSVGSDNFYTEKWLLAIKAHKDYILNRPDTQIKNLSEVETIKYRNDIFSLFKVIQIPPQYHVAFMIINGIDNPQAFNSDFTRLLLPSEDVLLEIYGKTF
jgi:hypothetical protein